MRRWRKKKDVVLIISGQISFYTFFLKALFSNRTFSLQYSSSFVIVNNFLLEVNILKKFFHLFFVTLAICLCFWNLQIETVEAKNLPEADFLTYEELKTLYEQKTFAPPLEVKLSHLLKTPIIDNSYQNKQDPFPKSLQLGKYLRVAQWNIQYGIEYEMVEAIFSSETKFLALLDKEKYPDGSEVQQEILNQARALRGADVIILNEVDWGLKRTNYRNVAADLAERLGMNYAFGVQFVELSPIYFSQESADKDQDKNNILKIIKVDPERYKGLNGTAILSRFPLENVRLIPFHSQPYDWYASEKKDLSILEKGKRELSRRVFLEKTLREVRRGGRMMLLADIVDERLPSGRVTVTATQLENRTSPSNRQLQLKELLETIKDIHNPVILAGDMNTSTEDLTPTSFRREFLKRFGKPKFWIDQGIGYLFGIGFVEDFLISAFAFGHKFADPTVRHIPFIAPNYEKKFFTRLKEFRFADGKAFDLRGDRTRSYGIRADFLSNSNQRGQKGFIATYQVKRPIMIVGKYKLDWIFVKPANLTNPQDTNESYVFAPHFARTLYLINTAIKDHVSDHRPLLVDLPLGEPFIQQ